MNDRKNRKKWLIYFEQASNRPQNAGNNRLTQDCFMEVAVITVEKLFQSRTLESR